MSYFPMLVTITCFLWFVLDRSSWSALLIASVFLFCSTVWVTHLCFPFGQINLPITGVDLAFIQVLIGLPITILNIVALTILIKAINQNKKHIFVFILVSLGLLCFGAGFIYNDYQRIPINNLNSYIKQREYIVSLIKTGTLHGERSCIQNFKFYEKDVELDTCKEEIELPEKYKGLSRKGKVYLTKTPEQLSISFTHSTYGFGDGSIEIVYSSSDNNLSKPTWAINPPPISNR